MTSKQKEKIEIELTEKQLKQFTNPKQAEKYIFDFNVAVDQGMNLKDARREADRRNLNVDERTKVEMEVFIRSLSLDSKKGKELNYNTALKAVKDTQSMTSEDIKKEIDRKIAEMRKTLEVLAKLNSIPHKTHTKEPQKMKPVEDKKVATFEMYLLTTDKITINYDGQDIKKIKIIIDNETGSAERLFSLADNNKENGSVLRNLLDNNAKISLYYFDEKGIEREIKANEYKTTLALFNDEQLGKMLFKKGV